MTWRTFEEAAPEMAAFAKEHFAQRGAAVLIGTSRRDGSPRISSIESCILNDNLYLGMMWQSRKAQDLQRDPRVLVRNAVCANTGNEREVSLRGRATEIHDREVRRRFAEAVETTWHEPHFHLFVVAIESAAVVTYGAGQQSVRLWPQDVEFTRPYG